MTGLQIQRYRWEPSGMPENPCGQYCLFSDADQFHRIAQEKIGENLTLTSRLDRTDKCCNEQRDALAKLTAERDGLREALKDYESELRDYAYDHPVKITIRAALKAVVEEGS